MSSVRQFDIEEYVIYNNKIANFARGRKKENTSSIFGMLFFGVNDRLHTPVKEELYRIRVAIENDLENKFN